MWTGITIIIIIFFFNYDQFNKFQNILVSHHIITTMVSKKEWIFLSDFHFVVVVVLIFHWFLSPFFPIVVFNFFSRPSFTVNLFDMCVRVCEYIIYNEIHRKKNYSTRFEDHCILVDIFLLKPYYSWDVKTLAQKNLKLAID